MYPSEVYRLHEIHCTCTYMYSMCHIFWGIHVLYMHDTTINFKLLLLIFVPFLSIHDVVSSRGL